MKFLKAKKILTNPQPLNSSVTEIQTCQGFASKKKNVWETQLASTVWDHNFGISRYCKSNLFSSHCLVVQFAQAKWLTKRRHKWPSSTTVANNNNQHSVKKKTMPNCHHRLILTGFKRGNRRKESVLLHTFTRGTSGERMSCVWVYMREQTRENEKEVNSGLACPDTRFRLPPPLSSLHSLAWPTVRLTLDRQRWTIVGTLWHSCLKPCFSK